MKIETEPKTLQALLSEAFYVVPRYQRPYSWDTANLDDFWDDVTSAEADSYFIGPMVFYRGGKQSKIEPTCEVVDGQQRLTSAFLMLAAIRDKLAEIDEKPLSDRVQTYLERLDRNAHSRFVLKVEQEYPFFQTIIAKQNVGTINIENDADGKMIRDASRYFKAQIDKVAEAASRNAAAPNKSSCIKERMVDIRDRLLSLLVNAIYLDSEDDAYVVFETLNTRGKDLEIVDLVKNLIMRNMREVNADLDMLKDDWSDFIEKLGGRRKRSSHNHLIYHSWLSRYPYVAQKKVFSTIKKKVTPDQVRDYWSGLKCDAVTFARIRSTARSSWGKQELRAMASLQALITFDVSQPMPLIISLVRAYEQHKIKLKALKTALRMIECFHFKYTAIAGISSSGGVSLRYAALARQVDQATNEKEMQDALSELRTKLADSTPSEETFIPPFMELAYGRSLRDDELLVRYVLAEIDYAQRKDDGIDYSVWTVEHIAPQSNSSCNQRYTIGNLLLVSPDTNTKLDRLDLTAKLELLRSRGYPIDAALASANEWGDPQIDERSKFLGRFAYQQVWTI